MAGKRILAVPIFLLVSALLFLSIGPGSGVQATNYNTTYKLWLSDYTPGAVTDVITEYTVGEGTYTTVRNINFGQILSATGYPEANIVMDSDIPDGTAVGRAVNDTTLSLINVACVAGTQVVVPFMECTTDTLKTAPWVGSGDNLVQDNDGDMNEAGTSAPQGEGDCIDGIDNDGDGDADGYDTDGVGGIEDPECNWDGTTLAPEVTDTNGIPTYCDHYPGFMNEMFNNIRPRARYMGHDVVIANAPATMLDFVIFNPEALFGVPTVQGQLGDTYGFLDFVVLDNPIAAVSPSTITDFCVPLTSNPTLKGMVGGPLSATPQLGEGKYTVNPGPEPYEAGAQGLCGNAVDDDSDTWIDDGCLVQSDTTGPYQRSENPAALTGLFGTGTHVVRTYSMSQRDADGDGLSNQLDSCPLTANTGVDADGDGIDAACDLELTWHGSGTAPTCYNDGTPDNCGGPHTNAPGTCPSGVLGLPDADQDCFPDRQDICPLKPNGDPFAPTASGEDQFDGDNPPSGAASDLGPPLDGIADACEDGDWDGDGVTNNRDRIRGDECDDIGDPLYPCETNCNDNVDDDADTVADDGCTTSDTFSNGHFHVALAITAVCIPDPLGADDSDTDGDSDDDDDGWCDSTEVLLNSDKDDPAETPEHIALDLEIGSQEDGALGNGNPETGANCGNLTDDDADTLADEGCPASCNDGIDNGGDTLIDSADPDCYAEGPGTCSDFDIYNHPSTPLGGVDNDGDTLANAADPDCAPIASTDSDQDGVCDGAKTGTCVAGNDNCPYEKNQEQVDRDGDGDGDECDMDDDGDGFSDVNETNIGTDPKDACAELADGNDAWPLDFDQDRDADIVDVLKFKPVILKPLLPGGHRFDFDADGDADIVDVLKFKPYILTSCTAFPGNT